MRPRARPSSAEDSAEGRAAEPATRAFACLATAPPLGAGDGGRAPASVPPAPCWGQRPAPSPPRLFRAGRGSSGRGAGRGGASGQKRPGLDRRGGGGSDARAGGRRCEAAAGARPQRGEAWGLEAAAAAMPLLFLERFPWPSLRTYTGLSGLALLGTIVSAYRALSQPEAGSGPGEPEPLTAPVQPEPAALAGPGAGGPRARDVAQYLLSDSLFVWVSEAAPAGRGGAGQGPPCHPLSRGA